MTSLHYVDKNSEYPDSLRILICGVGGQGNLFLGKVITHIIQLTPYMNTNIIKGEVHGMAQKGGCVSSTFACGNVYSPIFSSQSVDIMIAMEQNEALRPHYLNLLKPNATIILNQFSITPIGQSQANIATQEQILQRLDSFEVLPCNANQLAPLNPNAAIIGLLSSTFPFVSIPRDLWIRVFKKLSGTPAQEQQNIDAFECGRNELLVSLTKFSNIL